MLRIILIGYGKLAEGLINGILNTDHKIVGFVSWDRRKKISRLEQVLFPDKLEKLRKKGNIPVLDVRSVNSYDFVKKATRLEPDIILIGSWGEILKRHAIDVPIRYCINCHPSYLPYHRGSNPYASALMSGEEYTGVTFHEVDENIDTGRIIKQEKLLISISDNGETIRDKCSKLASEMIPGLLSDIETNRVKLKVQNEAIASYYRRINITDGAINWDNSALEIHNRIRGLYPWIPSYTLHKSKMLLINKSTLIETDISGYERGTIISVINNGILVATATRGTAIFLEDISIFGLSKLISWYYLKKSLLTGDKLLNAL